MLKSEAIDFACMQNTRGKEQFYLQLENIFQKQNKARQHAQYKCNRLCFHAECGV
jgi:hypothetical protein